MRLASVFRFLGRALFLVLALALCALITLRVLAALREDQSLADALPAEGRLVATSMGDIYVEELGPEEGPALLLFHGSVGWSRLWRPTQEVLAAAGWRTIAFDMPPMGFSARDPVRGYDRTTQARRVRALVQAMGLRPVLVAHSFGAGAAAEAAMLDPAAYAGLVVVSGAIGLGSQADAALPIPLQSAWVRQLAVAATANSPYASKGLLRLFLFQKDVVDADLLAVLRRPGRLKGSTGALAEWLPSLLSTSGQALSIRATSWQDVAVPLALVWGDRDTTTPLAQGQILSELAAAPLFILQEVGHIPQIEAPDAFHAALIKALAAVQPSFLGPSRMPFTLATWNINSVRLRESLVQKLLTEQAPDILCLQECKTPIDSFPTEGFAALGYPYLVARGQKGYNGVAILSKQPITDAGSVDYATLGHARHVAARLENGVVIHNCYVPAGGDIPDRAQNVKFGQKLDFLTDMRDAFHADRPARAILVGDLNIAPREDDVWNHKQLLKIVSHTPIEVEHLLATQDAGRFVDVTRQDVPAGLLYSWWSYRSPGWDEADKGRRLDHVWATPDIATAAHGSRILRAARGWDQPSDHAPVFATFDL